METMQGVIGNCRTLATVGMNGELRYLFWPTIDYPQHIHGSMPGAFIDGNFTWLTDAPWKHRQLYLQESNVLETTFTWNDVKVTATDFVVPDRDILVRRFRFAGDRDALRFFYYNDTHILETPIGDAAYYDAENDAIITYKRNFFMALGGDRQTSGHQCGVHGEGSDAFSDAYDGLLSNNSLALYLGVKGVNSCLSWDINDLGVGESEGVELNLFLCMGRNKSEAVNLLEYARKSEEGLLKRTIDMHTRWLRKARALNTDQKVVALVKRSLLALKALSCSALGGFIAAPTLEPDYRYCWPRDAAYMAYALELSGYLEEAAAFYRWAKKAQEEDGSWHQRYYIEACCPGPSWGMQCDQAGTILWGIGRHYAFTRDKDFLKEMWSTVQKACGHLSKVLDPDTNLVKSLDLWEERTARNTYTNASIAAGFREASKTASALGRTAEAKEWSGNYKKIKEGIIEHLWSEADKRFLKSVDPLDETIDISLLGLSIPFEILHVEDKRMRSTAEQIEDAFHYHTGGIGRYPGDAYYGGNPWILTSLWLAIYYAKLGNARAQGLIDWVVQHTPELGLMPEQVHRDTGAPLSASPLGWSHAMFIIAAREVTSAITIAKSV